VFTDEFLYTIFPDFICRSGPEQAIRRIHTECVPVTLT
jgi:hypothetical protein